jgi:hypothetical protein
VSQDIDLGSIPSGLGVTEKVLPATQYTQGGRTQYDIVLPVSHIVETLNRPDHTKAIALNRKIKLKHAQDFAHYLLTNADFGCPSIMVRVQPGIVHFDKVHAFDELHTAWGWVRFKFGDIVLFLVLDGQHRVLGCWIAVETVRKRVAELQSLITKAKANGEPSVTSKLQAELKIEQDKLARLMTNSITVQFVETDEDRGKRLFVDINDNVESVRPDFRRYLDDRSAIGLITGDVIETHPLLVGRVETGQEQGFSKTNKALLGVNAVSEVVRAVLVGATGRVGARVEDELLQNQDAKAAEVRKFLDLLVNYTDLRKVADNELDPPDLRYDNKDPDKPHATMLASTTMLRVLAGVYHDLITADPKTGMASDGKPPMTRAEVGMFFRSLGPLLKQIPVTVGSPWHKTGAFVEGGSAPTARGGQIGMLAGILCTWARDGLPAIAGGTAAP